MRSKKYDGVNLQASYRLSDAWQLGGNYTWSHAYGNYEGETASSGPVCQHLEPVLLPRVLASRAGPTRTATSPTTSATAAACSRCGISSTPSTTSCQCQPHGELLLRHAVLGDRQHLLVPVRHQPRLRPDASADRDLLLLQARRLPHRRHHPHRPLGQLLVQAAGVRRRARVLRHPAGHQPLQRAGRDGRRTRPSTPATSGSSWLLFNPFTTTPKECPQGTSRRLQGRWARTGRRAPTSARRFRPAATSCRAPSRCRSAFASSLGRTRTTPHSAPRWPPPGRFSVCRSPRRSASRAP